MFFSLSQEEPINDLYSVKRKQHSLTFAFSLLKALLRQHLNSNMRNATLGRITTKIHIVMNYIWQTELRLF